MKAPSLARTARVAGTAVLVVVVLAAPVWLRAFGTLLAVEDALQPADVALVLEGTGADAADAAEGWRQQGTVREVVIVEAPIKTHALVAYWSDFVRWGLTAAPSTPPEHVRIVRARSTQAAQQALAALPALHAFGAQQVLVAGGGGIGSRLVARELGSVFGPAGISLRMVHYGRDTSDPGRWYLSAADRRAVLDTWLQVLVPFLSEYQPD